MPDLHKDDFYAWSAEQAALLRSGNVSAIDAANIAEELEDMAGNKRDQLINRLGILLAHLLKWRFQPQRRGRNWAATIREQRRRIDRLLRQNPASKTPVKSCPGALQPDRASGLRDSRVGGKLCRSIR